MADVEHPNLALVHRIGSAIGRRDFADVAAVFGKDGVWHYFNPRLPELAGDYVGASGVKTFFGKLAERTSGNFIATPVSAEAIGDELVFAHARLQLTLDGRAIETDAILVWRIYEGQVVEVWDIPAVHARP